MQANVSIIVTCHEYGHFLEACLCSLEAQSRRPDQIIVVNDGSTDATRSVALARGEGLVLLEKEHGGQASAFNAGFALATGDIVLFLDADDTLVPDALEILCGVWHESLAAISFKLNVIDAAGRFSGFYSVEPHEGDMRPELLGRGQFPFLPTSGNVFSRRVIAPCFPLPEQRWHVSADAVLLRVAALAGPIRQLPIALGNYRSHGGNSYHRAALPELQFMRRGLADAADACLAIAGMSPDTGLFGDDPEVVRLELVFASIRLRLRLADCGVRQRQAWSAARLGLRPLLKLRIGLRAKIVSFCGVALLPLSVWLVPRSRVWFAAREQRPRVIDRVAQWAQGADLVRRRRAVHRARWSGTTECSRVIQEGTNNCALRCNPFDWNLNRAGDRYVLHHPAGEVDLSAGFFMDGAVLNVDLAAVGPYVGIPLTAAIDIAGERLGQASVLAVGRISVTLEPGVTLPEAPIRLEISALPRPRSLAERWVALTGPAAVVEIAGLTIDALSTAKSGVMLSLGEHLRFEDIAAACQTSPPPDLAGARPDRVEAEHLGLSLIRPALAEPSELILRFAADQIAGNLVVADAEGPLYRARIGGSAVARVPVRARQLAEDRELALSMDLDPEDPFLAASFHLASIGLTSPSSHPDPDWPPSFPMIGLGAIQSPAEAPWILGDGWHCNEIGAVLFETLGTLRFTVDPVAPDDAELHVRIAPAMPTPPDAVLPVAVSLHEKVLTQVLLQGEDNLIVPLRDPLCKGERQIELAVHIALVSNVGGRSADLRRGGLLLRSIRLVGHPVWLPPPQVPSPRVGHTLTSEILTAGRHAKTLREQAASFDHAELAVLITAHHSVVSGIRNLAHRTVQAVLLNEDTLDSLLHLGQLIEELGEGADAMQPEGGCVALFSADGAEAVRSAALAILTLPPWRAMAGSDFFDLSESVRAVPVHLARYLCSTSHPLRTEADLAEFRKYAQKLLAYCRTCFAVEPRGSRHERLAEALIREFRPHPLLFGPGSLRALGEARGGAIETHLLARGRRITLVRPHRRSTGRLRLGILVRDVKPAPETWILAGTIGLLPPETFDVTLFVLGRGTKSAARLPDAYIVALDGVGVDRAVDIIRAAQLDVFLLGVFFQNYNEIAAIVAHRLAPVQVATTAVSPMTTGFRSFDAMVSAAGFEPPDAASHYTERLHLSATPVQRFDLGKGPPAVVGNRALERARLGIPENAVVLTSGAMLLKVGHCLLETWIDIIAAVPAAVLLLYPFAPNWHTTFHGRARFEREVERVCAAKGVGRERVVILDRMDHVDVERILHLSDVYLDSFPYAGATTVVQALRLDLPVVALAGDSQRGLQGAAWLRTCGLGHLVAATREEYVAIASRLAKDPKARDAAAGSIRWPEMLEPSVYRQHFASLLVELAGRPSPPRAPRLLFHHMPKAAGTTCRKVFAEWFTIHHDDAAPWDESPPPPPINVDGFGSHDLLCGHFNVPGRFVRERYPALIKDSTWRLITFLRDPLETAISLYFFEREHRPKADPTFTALELDAYLGSCSPRLLQHLDSIDTDWRKAYDHYWFVGTTGHLDDCMHWLAEALGKPIPVSIGWCNDTPRDERPSDEAIRNFVQRNAIDFEIFPRRLSPLREDPSDRPTR